MHGDSNGDPRPGDGSSPLAPATDGGGAPEAKRAWFQLTLLQLLVILNVLGCLMVAAIPRLRVARAQANTRACYTNQKTMACALEMFNLDKMTKVDVINDDFVRVLKSESYLAEYPVDPGQETTNLSANYQYTGAGCGIKCTVHGQP